MAENVYRIIIEDAGGSGGGGGGGVAPSPTPAPVKNTEEVQSTRRSKAMGLAALHLASSTARQVVAGDLSLIEIRTGNARMQQRAEFAMNTAFSTFGTITAIGASYAALGPVASTVVAAAKLGEMGISLAVRQMQIEASREAENLQIRQNEIRAGATGGRDLKGAYS